MCNVDCNLCDKECNCVYMDTWEQPFGLCKDHSSIFNGRLIELYSRMDGSPVNEINKAKNRLAKNFLKGAKANGKDRGLS